MELEELGVLTLCNSAYREPQRNILLFICRRHPIGMIYYLPSHIVHIITSYTVHQSFKYMHTYLLRSRASQRISYTIPLRTESHRPLGMDGMAVFLVEVGYP